MTDSMGPEGPQAQPPAPQDPGPEQQYIPRGAPLPPITPMPPPPANMVAPYPQQQQVGPGGYPVAGYPGYVVAPKSPAVAVLLSFFFPGVGSLVSGGTTTGTIILIGWLVSIPLMFVCVGFLTYLGFWIWGMFDAYSSAQKWNLAHGIIS